MTAALAASDNYEEYSYYDALTEKQGGIKFSKENIKPGYIVKLRSSWKGAVKVISTGPKNIKYKDIDGTGFELSASYSEIVEVLKAEEITEKQHPFEVGETFTIEELADKAALLLEDKERNLEDNLPDVPDWSKQERLGYEKEVLGVYISGHPLEEYDELIKRNVSNKAIDFALPEEGEEPVLKEGEKVVIGGIINSVNRKTTKSNQQMAFVTLEDLYGEVEVIVFPRDYEKYREILVEGNKILFAGRVSEDEERDSKLICSGAVLFEEVGMQIWLQFEEKTDYEEKRAELEKILSEKGSEGNSSIFIYVRKEKQIKKLSEQIKVEITSELLDALKNLLGEGNVKLSSEKVNWRF